MIIEAAVLAHVDAPFLWERLKMREPDLDEILVRIEAVSICHTDLAVRSGHIGVPFPCVLGHEASGIVEKAGACVEKVKPGDRVVLSFAHCGGCDRCLEGHPAHCRQFFPRNFAGHSMKPSHFRTDGTPVFGRFFGQSSFATYALTSARHAVKVPTEFDPVLIAPLGCGFLTGASTIHRIFKPRAGQSLVVWGLGPVGLGAVSAGLILGLYPVIGIDLRAERRAHGKKAGAHHVLDSRNRFLLNELRELAPKGIDLALDTTGDPAIVRKALKSLAPLGQCALVAATPRATRFELEPDLFFPGRILRGVIEGDAVPQTFIPLMLQWIHDDRFPIRDHITVFPFREMVQAVQAVESAEVVKAVLVP